MDIDEKNHVEIFFCYAREDEDLRQNLEKQLRLLRRQGLIDIWHDRQISAGTEWAREIDKHLNTAQIILLLVSPDFMDSDYAYSIEMERAMERHQQGEACVIPIILRPVFFKNAPFGKLQALPTDAVPVTSSKWHSRDEAFYDVAEGIRKIVENWDFSSTANDGSEKHHLSSSKVTPTLSQPLPIARDSLNQTSSLAGQETSSDGLPQPKQLVLLSSPLTASASPSTTLFSYQGLIVGADAMAWSPNGRYIASISGRYTPSSLLMVQVWDATTGTTVVSCLGNTASQKAVAWSPNGKYIASAGEGFDGTVQVWNAATGDQLLTYNGHSPRASVESVAWSPDGKRIVSGTYNREVRVWDAATGTTLVSYGGHGAMNSSSTLVPSPSQWANAAANTSAAADTSALVAVAWSPDGKRIASATMLGGVHIWDAATGTKLLSCHGHTRRIMAMAWSPNGKYIASGSWDNTVQVWDAATGTKLVNYKHTDGGGVNFVAWSPDSKRIASGGGQVQKGQQDVIQVWDATPGFKFSRILLNYEHPNTGQVAWSPDGKRIASASGGEVRVWDSSTGNTLLTYQGHHSGIRDVSWSSNGRLVATLDPKIGMQRIRIWDALTGSELVNFEHTGSGSRTIALSPDGERIITGPGDKTVQVWDAATGTHLLSCTGHAENVCAVTWSPDGKRIASGSWDKTVQVWDAATGTRLTSYLGHTSLQGRLAEVQAIAWSPDGKYIASGSRDNNDVHLWDAATGVRLRLLSLPEHDLDATGHLMGVLSLAWSPDGKYIASGSYKIVQIWNAATGAKLTSYLGHTSGVTSVAWSPDGKYIASGSRDLQVWEAMSTKLVSYGPHARGVYKVIWSPDGSRIATLSSGGICIWQAV